MVTVLIITVVVVVLLFTPVLALSERLFSELFFLILFIICYPFILLKNFLDRDR